ncbi:hypothetical protein TGVEG_442000 [Toxoplasma gondii VEG]|uniref:Uncharacterized protein n=1 Tax=Toxoplasma gondii (strain ATCC 50861 / VEG) TaxID=432359 RepID=V4YIK9_TOXGV|nr:hypothetical protein TGVEG_442000 [Toxoplasma gondii VEG]
MIHRHIRKSERFWAGRQTAQPTTGSAPIFAVDAISSILRFYSAYISDVCTDSFRYCNTTHEGIPESHILR